MKADLYIEDDDGLTEEYRLGECGAHCLKIFLEQHGESMLVCVLSEMDGIINRLKEKMGRENV